MIEFWLETPNGSFHFYSDHVSLGRSRDCSFVLPDPSVMPMHAGLLAEGGRLFIERQDRDALTFVNRAPIHHRVEVFNGDLIDIGPWTIHLRCPTLPRRELPRHHSRASNATPSDVTLVRRVRRDHPMFRRHDVNRSPDESTNSIII